MNYENEYKLWCLELGLDPDETCNWEMFLEEYEEYFS